MVDESINPKKLILNFKEFVFNIVFLVGFILGLILGIVTISIVFIDDSPFWSYIIAIIISLITGYWSNSLWEKHKKKQRGDEPYFNVYSSTSTITFEGQLPNTESNKAIIIETLKKADPA
jgi:uncharacterized protein YacL